MSLSSFQGLLAVILPILMCFQKYFVFDWLHSDSCLCTLHYCKASDPCYSRYFPTFLSRYFLCNKNIYFLSNHCKDKPFMSTIPIITICFFLFEFVTNNETMLWKMHCIGLVWFLEGVAIFSSSWIWPADRAIIPSKMEVAPHPQNNWYQTSHKTF